MMSAIELAPVMQKLERRFVVTPLKPRHERIQQMIEKNNPNSDWSARIMRGFKQFNEHPGNKDIKERLKDDLVAFMFIKNRERYKPEVYDFEKERRQVRAVTAFLDGKHIHMGTREGKTSTVFPITSIVDALTSDIRSSVLVGTDEILLGKLKSHADFFNKALSEVSPQLSLSFEDKRFDHSSQGLDKESKKKMLTEGLLDGDYTEESRRTIMKNYWSDAVAADRKEETVFKIQSVYFATDRDLVFDYQEDPQKFRRETGNMFFDEADVPYSRRSPYASVNEDQYYSPGEMVDSTIDWMRRFIVSKQLTESNYVLEGGGHTLSESTVKRLHKLKISEHLRGYDFERSKSQDAVVAAFNEGVEIVAKKLGLEGQAKKRMANKLANTHLNFEPENSEVYYENVGNDLARLHKKKGLLYTMVDGNPKVRDSYIDQMLQDHKFSSQEQMNILVLEGEYDFVPLNPVAFKTTTFQSFAKATGDKLHCASGTLMFPDPESHKITRSSFASFLKDATGKDIEVVSPPAIKTVPNPNISTTEKEAINALVNSVPEKPTLIVSYHLDNSREIYDQLVERLGKDKVGYIRSKPSETSELAQYEKETARIYTDLAEGRLKAVVSSGAAGFGVDIIKENGSFPDLHVALHGLPVNRAQMMQIYGRRGAPGDDFSWFVSEEFLEPYIMLFEERNGALLNALGSWDRDEVRKRIAESKGDPTTGRHLMLEIVRTSETSENNDDELAILMDEYVAIQGKKITEDMNTKIKGLPGIFTEIKKVFTNEKETIAKRKDLEEKYGDRSLKIILREDGLFSILTMTDEEFSSYSKKQLSEKEIKALNSDVGKNGMQAIAIMEKTLPGMTQFTDRFKNDFKEIAKTSDRDILLKRLAAIRATIKEFGWNGTPDIMRQFLSQQMGLPDGMKGFLMEYLVLAPREIPGSDMRSLVLSLDRYLTKNSVVSDYATAWYNYRRQEVEEYMGAVNEGGELYFHQPLDPKEKHIFSSISPDPQVKGLEWGRTRLWAEDESAYQDFLSYKKGSQIYLLRDDQAEYLSYSSSDEFKNRVDTIISEKAYNVYGAGYSFLTK